MQKYQAIKGDEVIETLTLSATSTTSRATFAAATVNGQPKRLVISNAGTVPVFVKQGNNTVAATTADKVVLGGQSRAFLFSAGDSVAVITSTTATVYAEACN